MGEVSAEESFSAHDMLPPSTFWGACLRPNKKIRVTVPDDATLHITCLTLEPGARPGRNVVICRHGDNEENMRETAVCVLAAGKTESFQYAAIIVGETVEFLNQGESTVHMTGYTVESEFSDDEFDTADSVANGSESASESDGDVPSDEEHRAIMEDMKRQQELGTFDAEFSDSEEDGVEGTEDEEEDEDEGSDEEEPEGKADGVEGTGSDEDEDESSDESSDEEEDEVIAEPPIKKAKKEGKGTPQAPAAKKAKQQPKESMQPAPAAEPSASTVAPLPKSSSSSSSSSTAKPQPNTADGKAALETWFAAVATFIQANPGAKLNMIGSKLPLPVAGKLGKQLKNNPRFTIDPQTQVVTVA